MPKNRDYKTSSYWYPKPTRRTQQVPEIKCQTLADRLKVEDGKFDKQWKAYWRQRSKWASFEEYLKSAA